MKTKLNALFIVLILCSMSTIGFGMGFGVSGGSENEVPQGAKKTKNKERKANRRSCRGGVIRSKNRAGKRKPIIDAALESGDVQQLVEVIGLLNFEQLTKYIDSLENITLADGSIGERPEGTFLHALIWQGSAEQLEAFLSMGSFMSNACYWLLTPDAYGLTPRVYATPWPEKVALLDAAQDRVREPLSVAPSANNQRYADASRGAARHEPEADSFCTASTATPVVATSVECIKMLPRHTSRLDFADLTRALVSGRVNALVDILNGGTFEQLVQYKDFTQYSNGTFMHALVRLGSDEQMAAFLSHPLFTQAKDYWLTHVDSYGSPPLQNAANFNKTEKVRLLVNAGASVRHVDAKTGRSLFQYAMVYDNDVMLDILMQGHDFTSELLDLPDAVYNFPPINYAVVNGRVVMVMKLRAGGANLLWTDAKGRSLLSIAIAQAENPNDPAQKGNYSMLQLLLRTECCRLIDEPDDRGFTPLEAALKEKRPDLVELLVSAGANLLPLYAVSRSNYLHRAVFHQNVLGLKIILEAVAARNGQGRTLGVLLAQRDIKNRTPLQLAQELRDFQAVDMLEKWEQRMRASAAAEEEDEFVGLAAEIEATVLGQ